MSKRPASTLIEQADAAGIALFSTVTALPKDGSAPEWITLFPKTGRVETRDGRGYDVAPEVLSAAYAADDIMIPVDINHSTDWASLIGGRSDAVGWVTALRVHEGGLQAKVDWLDEGRELLSSRKYLYTSPSFYHDQNRATRLRAVALVTSPALARQPALAHAGGQPSEPSMKQIAKALGLPETADEAACLAALGARAEVKPLAAALGLPTTADAAACLAAIGGRVEIKPLAAALGLPATADAAACLSAIGNLKGGAPELVAQLQGQLTTTSAQLQTLMTAQRNKDVTDLLEGALKERRIVPAQRESLATLCATDEGLKGVKAMLAATTPGLQPSGLDDRGQPAGGDGAIDAVTLSAAAQKIQDDAKAAGRPISFSDAITLAQKKPAA